MTITSTETVRTTAVPSAAVRLVVGDGSVFFAEGLRTVLEGAGQGRMLGHATQPGELVLLARRHDPEVVISSFEPVSHAISAARQISGPPVLILTSSRRQDDLLDALRAGARGLVHKDVPPVDLARALRELRAGRTAFPPGWERLVVSRLDDRRLLPIPGDEPVSLTQRERDIVQLVVEGYANKALALRLGIAHQTAKNHLRSVMAKVRVTSRIQLCTWAMEQGYMPGRVAAGN
ncbi:MAG: LuxR C-terminal-related transcriptional regulator [Acidimicrobiia bacterium]